MQRKRVLILVILAATLSLITGGCSSLRPLRSAESTQSSPLFIAPTRADTPAPQQPVQTDTVDAQPENCINQLTYEKDLTIPDGAFVQPGSSLDKQWQVSNSGTCNWNDTYTIRLINGDLLGAVSPQAIVPARSGAKTTIRILFTAPLEPGNYTSTWQAFDPQGQTFGDYFKIVINVSGN